MDVSRDCLALFDAEGTAIPVGGNRPVLLAEPDAVWLVQTGRVEVFSVAVDDGEPAGARHHFFTAQAGDALFGMDLERYGEGQGFLAVGMAGTSLLKLSVARLRAHLDDPAFAAGLAPLVERWVSGLSAGIVRTIVPLPRADLQIDAGDDGMLASGQRVRARRAVAWVEHVAGASLFIGMEDVPPGTRFPVTGNTWLQALGPVQVSSVATGRALATADGWAGLEAFYGALFRCEFFNTRLAAADELNRLREKAARDRRLRAASLLGLAEVLTGRPSAVAGTSVDDPLLAAMTIVGEALRIDVKAPPRPKDDEPKVDPLDAIVRASRIRGRVVVLQGEWWRDETWPLLAFAGEDGRPVAVLPARGGFDVVDPTAGTRTRVTREVAERLAPRAHTFYRPFPARVLTPLDLLRFGGTGSMRDVLRPFVVGLAGGALAMVPPHFTGLLVDSVIPEAARGPLIQIALILAVVGVTTMSFDIVRRLSILRLETRMSAIVQPAMWDRLLGLRIAFFRRFAAGDLAQRVAGIDTIRSVLSGAASTAVMTSLFSVFLLAQMLYYSPRLGLLGLGLVLVATAATLLAGHLKLLRQREVMRVEGRLSALVLQLLTGISKLRVAGAEGRAFAEWAREFAAQKKLALRAGRIENGLTVFGVVSPVVSSILIFHGLVAWGTQDDPMSAGTFVAFNAAFGAFLAQMLTLGNTAMDVLVVIPVYERALPILQAVPEVDATKVPPGELTGQIDVDHVTFRYIENGPVVLHDVSLRIGAGEYVALVGPSGSGKSTLLRLLLGLDVPESGSVYYDGRNLSQLDVAMTRRRMGVVMQSGRIRAGTIFDNIIGSAPLTLDDAWEAVRMAGFDEDIRQMPMGMQTVMQQGGLTLSGGQRQRLMIARALVNRPRILLFDEATSALDNRTQAIVTRSLRELQATRVAVAHRLSTIEGADRIYVMDQGRIVQAGSYAELAGQAGLFADLIRRQVA